MPRPAATPRLDRIDADALAEEAHRRAHDHLHSHAMRLGAEVSVEREGFTLRHAVECLVAYAQGRHDLDAPVAEYLQTIYEALWIRAIDAGHYETTELDRVITSGDLDALDDDLVGQLIVVTIAALGRDALEHSRSLTVAQLAALASISPDYVRMLAREGQLSLSDDAHGLACRPGAARKLLISRGLDWAKERK